MKKRQRRAILQGMTIDGGKTAIAAWWTGERREGLKVTNRAVGQLKRRLLTTFHFFQRSFALFLGALLLRALPRQGEPRFTRKTQHKLGRR
jgi:hypothetical protein